MPIAGITGITAAKRHHSRVSRHPPGAGTDQRADQQAGQPVWVIEDAEIDPPSYEILKRCTGGARAR